ncbi:hypothetical protein B0H13DRAFT_1854561 [Mycena leptocephala]|nr:hypothetical protein B0H13DRAFT_1854561 [Mycena leptocephala]
MRYPTAPQVGHQRLFYSAPASFFILRQPEVIYKHDEDDENTLTATGDISLSYPYYVPGMAGALSPKPQSRRGTPNLRATRAPQRPRPPVRRIGSNSFEQCHRVEPASSSRNDPSTDWERHAGSTPRERVWLLLLVLLRSIGSIEDEDPQLSTPQSRFEAFMKSRDLARSPKKKEGNTVTERNASGRLDALAQAATSALGREVARPNTRPLRGNARLPPRPPIPNWNAMDVDKT